MGAPGDPPSPFLTPEELAEELRVTIRTVYRWRRNDEGPPAIKVGGQLRYRRTDVEQWLEAAAS